MHMPSPALPPRCPPHAPRAPSAPQVCLAMCTLLGVTLPRVPDATLRLKFGGCCSVLCSILERHRLQVSVC